MPRSSEDFLEFDTNDLIEELSRRCMTLVLAAKVEGGGKWVTKNCQSAFNSITTAARLFKWVLWTCFSATSGVRVGSF